MFSQIYSATVAVADQDRALEFYVGTLGWEKVMDAPFGDGRRWLTVMPPGAATVLVLAGRDWDEWAAPLSGGGDTGITLVTPDIEATYATLSELGVAFRAPVTTLEWGQKGTWFSDPDGNEFFLVEA
jgi:catechol 2,3-dioxygenase-like lactoylglutathione lyase family enzyme